MFQQGVVALGVLFFHVRHHRFNAPGEHLVAFGHGEPELVVPFQIDAELPGVGSRPVGFRGQGEGLQFLVRADDLQRYLGQFERFQLGVFQLGLNGHGLAHLVGVLLHQQHAAFGPPEQPPLGNVANQLGPESLEVAGPLAAQPPHLAAAQVEHPARTVKVPGQIDRFFLGAGGIVEAGKDGGRGLGAFDPIVAVHAFEGFPHHAAFLGRVGQLQKGSSQPFGSKHQPGWFLPLEAVVFHRGKVLLEQHWHHAAEPGHSRGLGTHPGVHIDRTGHHHQPAGLLGHPVLEHFDLLLAQLAPVEVESHDAVVVVKLLLQRREVVQQLVGVLGNSFLGGLQHHVDHHRRVAFELVAHEAVLARRPSGQQEHPGLVVHDLDHLLLFGLERFST